MYGCTHLSRFALVSGGFPKRNAKKYTGYCIIACVPMWQGQSILRTNEISKLSRPAVYFIPYIQSHNSTRYNFHILYST